MLRLLALLVLLPSASPMLSAQALRSTASPRTVQVSGDAEILVLPDEVVVRLGVETTDTDLNVAVAQNAAAVEGIEAAARRAGVPSDRIVTDQLGLEPQTTNIEVEVEGTRRGYVSRVYGHRVRRGITVTLRDLDAFDTLLRDAVAAGATYVHSVEFQTTELRRHRDEARILAVRAAREKAEALAGELGQTVGMPISISERGQGWFSGYGAGWGGWGSRFSAGPSQNVSVSSGESGPAAPGRIAVRASVDVTFALGE